MSNQNKTISLESLKSTVLTSEKIPTGITAFDQIIGGGFETTGTIVQLVSSSGLGKTTIACQICKNLCENDKKILYIDSEGSICLEQLESIGLLDYLDSSFFLIRTSTFKTIEKTMDMFIATGEIDFIVVDSLSSIMHDGFNDLSQNKGKSDDSKEKNNAISISTNNSNYNSRQLTLFLSKYSMVSKQRGISMLYINQFRTRITNLFNYAEEKIGGAKNVKYTSDIIIKISDNISKKNKSFTTFIKSEEYEPEGKYLEFEIVKSNKAKPGKKIPFKLFYGLGISNFYNLMFPLFDKGIINLDHGNYIFTPYDEDKSAFIEDKKETYKGITALINCYDYLARKSSKTIDDFYKSI